MQEPTEYADLRQQIEGLLVEGLQFGRRAAEWEKVETYWHIGDALAGFLDRRGGSTYGEQTLRQLSKDVRLSMPVLYDVIRFRRQIPRLRVRTHLGWTHYRSLLGLPPEAAARFEQLAEDHAWTTRQLKQAIEHDGIVPATSAVPASPLEPAFGEPATYRVVDDPFDPAGLPAIDLGFHQHWVPDGLPGFQTVAPGDCITLEGTAGGLTARRRVDQPGLWTYVARVRRVVDGDTLDVALDLGAGHRSVARLRLRGIDTAELYTQAGREAKAYVEQALADGPAVVIATHRTDTYGRYLADVQYLAGVADPTRILKRGRYLNGELLSAGLADRYL